MATPGTVACDAVGGALKPFPNQQSQIVKMINLLCLFSEQHQCSLKASAQDGEHSERLDFREETTLGCWPLAPLVDRGR